MPDRSTVMRDGVELVYWTWAGREPATLLLHGIGNYGRYWSFFADAIAGRLRLIAPDARGHGESGRPADGYAPADFVADALAVLDASGVDRAVVVGHSMGGTHAIHLAARNADRVRGLVIVDASPEPLAEGSTRAAKLLTDRPERFGSREEARAYIGRTSPGYRDEVYENRVEFAFRSDGGAFVWRSDPQALRKIIAARDSPAERWDLLEAIACPTLVVRGTRSNVLSEEIARRITSALADGRLMELDTGHNVALERPRELADAVVAIASRE
jgi:esterase